MKRSRLAAVPLGVPIGLLGVMATGAPAQAAGEPEPVDATAVTAPPAWRAVPDKEPERDEDLMDIPVPALAAYQRAETVLAEALPTCHLDAALLAGIGKVETDHGRIGTWRLGPAAVMRPYLIGAPITEPRHELPALTDTDGGTWDRDPAADHPIGPLQIAPSLWQRVAVDGDGDGLRRPFDLDDAALALGVALCGTDADLARAPERRAALRSLNDRAVYVRAVEEYRAAYAAPVVIPPVYVDTVGVVVTPPPAAAPAAAPKPAPKPAAKPAPKPAPQPKPPAPAPKPTPAPPKPTPAPKPPKPGPSTTPPTTPPPTTTPTPTTPPPAPTPVPTPPAPPTPVPPPPDPVTPPPPAPPTDPASEELTADPLAARTADPATGLTASVPGEALAATAP